MRFHISIALSASFVTALFTEWPQENLFDDPTPLEENASPYNTNDFLWDPFPTTVAADLPLDDVPIDDECTSSGLGNFLGSARIRREEGICPSPISSEDTDGFNKERYLRYRIQTLQNLAQLEGRKLPFCPPPTMPLCCVGELEYLGLVVFDCEPYDPLITACTDLVNIFCCNSYDTYMTPVVDISTGFRTQTRVGFGSFCIRVFGLPIVYPYQ